VSLRRLHHEQPESFAFTQANADWAERQIAKYPEGRQASAVIPLLWRGQEQEGWVTRPMIEEVGRLLDMDPIRVLEVATFYFMFQLQPVGSVAHIQICGTTSCMICGAEDLIAVCKDKIAAEPHEVSADGKFSWEEVECLGACANAPMAQIGKDYYEDLTAARLGEIIDAFARGEVPAPGPQTGRFASEPAGGATALTGTPAHDANASIDIARQLGDTVKRIDGTEPLPTWAGAGAARAAARPVGPAPGEEPATPPPPGDAPAEETERRTPMARATPDPGDAAPEPAAETSAADLTATPGPADAGIARGDAPPDDDKPELLATPRGGQGDDLTLIKGVGPKLAELCNRLGVWHFDQIAAWSPEEVAWVDHHLEGFKGRIARDDWVAQAKILAAGGDTEFSRDKR